jgi:hypothetical protein
LKRFKDQSCALPDQDTFAFLVNFHHVPISFLLVPTKDCHEDMRDVIHQVHGVIPANHEVRRCQISVTLGFPLGDTLGNSDGFRD